MNQDVVVVACKLPAGLIMEVGTFGQDNYARFSIAGTNSGLRDGKSNGILVGGYAFTNVPKDAWNEFVRAHKAATYLRTRAVFAEDSLDKAHAAALTDARLVTGFERLDPDHPADGLEADKEHLRNIKAQAPRLNAGLPE